MRAFRRIAMAAVIGTVLSVALVQPAAAADYPTWDEVQAARASQSATQTEVDRINAFITELTAESARLGTVTIEKAAVYSAAKDKLDLATQRADRLVAQSAQAAKDSSDAHDRYGRIVSQLLMSTGGQNLTLQLMLDRRPAGDLLYRLGAMSKLTEQAASLEASAEAKANLAGSLSTQADLAKTERDALAAAAQTALAEAQAAEKAAADKLAEQMAASTTLYAQLATLTTQVADVQTRYDQGQAARAAAEAAAAAAVSAGNGTVYTGDVGVDPAGAQAYAQSVLPNYGWGGDQFSCLVRLWNKESGWRANAYNASSGAYGIPQSLPAGKMASAGPDWRTNGATQVNWGLGYINSRYGSPCAAWAHSVATDWY